MRHRGAGRRRDREQRAEVAGEVRTPDELVDRARAQQRVARGVLELAEPYRSTVLLRYHEGLSGAEIARRQDVPAATVRSRLKTGLDRLRADLDREAAGGRERWMALLAPLAHAEPASPGISITAPVLQGALLVKSSTKIIAAVALLLVAGIAGSRYAGWWGGDGNDSAAATAPQSPANTGPARAPAAPAPVSRLGAVNAAISEDDPVGDLRLEGQVIDADERPVAGATVAIDSHPVRTVETEDDGSFVFARLIGRDYQLEAATGDGYAGPVHLRLGADTEPVILRMRPTEPLAVSVVDAASRKPVAGAAVEIRSHLVWTAITGSDGVATIGGVGAGDPMVHVSARGYAPAALRLVNFGRGQRRVELALRGGAPVSGSVVDASNKPVAGARVIASATSEPFPVIDPRRDGVVTDARGAFTIPALAAGTYRLTASAERLAPASSAPITVDGTSERTGVVIELPAGATLSGSVVTPGGEPISGADIRVVATGHVFWRSARRAYSGKNGTFSIDGLARRDFDVVASHDSGASEIARVELAESTSAEVKLELSITGTIAGTVVDAAGEVVPEARIYAEPEWSGGVEDRAEWGVRGELFRVADSGGAFAFRGLPKGGYRLRASRAGDGDLSLWASAGTPVSTGDAPIELTIPAPGGIKGRLLYRDGEAPEVFSIAVGNGRSIPQISDDGRFEIASPGGIHRVRVTGPAFAEKSVVATVEGGENADLGTITVEKGRSVSGRVLDPSGAPVAGAEVACGALLSGDGSKLYIPTESVGAESGTTGEDGRFVLTGFPKGPLTIVAGKEGVGRSSSIALPRGGESLTVDLVLAATGKLSGVIRKNGAPVAETVVIAKPLSATSANFFVVSGADGSYALDALTADEYIVYPMIGGGGPRPKDMYVLPVTIKAGETVTRDIEFKTGPVELAVQVTTDDATPVAAAAVFLFGIEIDVPNAPALRDGRWVDAWIRANPGNTEPVEMFMRQAMGGATTIANLHPKTYSACVIPAPVKPGDMAGMMKMADKLEELPLKCQTVKVAASPEKQKLEVEVPGAWARPPEGE
jgi:hypothetical protein